MDNNHKHRPPLHDECGTAPFAPVVILPAQISGTAQPASATCGPIALMLAIVDDAARCIDLGRRRRRPHLRKLGAEAEAWVRSDSHEWLFAFASICDVLGLDVDATRARLLADTISRDRRALVWRLTRGQGRTSVCQARATKRAA